jgi:hypothetical protein
VAESPLQDRTDELIACIVHKLGAVRGRVILAKLVYMADLEARGWLGHPLSSLEYKRDHGGPYDRAFEEHAKHVVDLVRMTWEPVIDYNVCTHEAMGRLPKLSFAPEELLVIDRTLAQYGAMSRREILEDVVYQTGPMKRAAQAELGAPLDMEPENFALKRKYGLDFRQVAESLDDIKAGRVSSVTDLLAGAK